MSAAFHLQRIAAELPYEVQYDVFEARERWGGVLQTTRNRGFLVESSADSFLETSDQPWGMQLVEQLGLSDQLIEPRVDSRKARILFRGCLHDVPPGFYLTATTQLGAVFNSNLLSLRGKLRLACERFVPRKIGNQEESLRQFAVRRVGREVFERLVQPLVAGIYTADPDRLSVAAALPKFVMWEQQFGSLTAGLRAERATERLPNESTRNASGVTESGARYAMFRTLRNGIGALIEALCRHLRPESMHPSHRVSAIRKGLESPWQLLVTNAEGRGMSIEYDGVLFAAPHLSTAVMLKSMAPKLATALNQVPSASVAIVSIGIHRDQLNAAPDCFGIVVPLVEQRDIIAASFSSVKFPDRAPDQHELIRVFIGGACQASLLENDDNTLRQIAIREIREILGITGEPLLCDVCRWTQATPQYELGHAARLDNVLRLLEPLRTLAITGNAFHGIGIPQCIHEARQNVERLLAACDSVQARTGTAR